MWIKKIKMKHSSMNIRELTAGGALSETEWHKLMEKYRMKETNA